MVYQLIPDSVAYTEWVSSMPPVYPALLHILKILGPLRFDAAVLVQCAVIIWGALELNKRLPFKRAGYRLASLLVLASPCLYWGRHIGGDALGYGLMLLAFSRAGNPGIGYAVFSMLAAFTKWQYGFLLAGFFLHKGGRWVAVALLAGAGAATLSFGLSGPQRHRVPIVYANCAYDTKPEWASHADWFNAMIAFPETTHGAILTGRKGDSCVSRKPDFFKIADTIRSKIYENFRIHQAFAFLLLLLAPFPFIRRLTHLNTIHYAIIFTLSSPYFQRYTFMVELTLVASILCLLDNSSVKP